MAQITYADKVAINENPNVNAINKIRDEDMNEIKAVVNENETTLSTLSSNVGDITQLTTTNKTSVVNAINELNNEVVLFSNDSGSTSASLSDSVSNYTYIEILFKETGNNKIYSSGKLLTNSSGFKTTLFYSEFPTSASGNIYLFGTEFEINGTSIGVSSGKYGYSIVNGSNNVNYENRIRILRVIGYK